MQLSLILKMDNHICVEHMVHTSVVMKGKLSEILLWD